jgi:hypothetical protein
VIVDRLGSRPYKEAREMFTGLANAGAEIVVNDVFRSTATVSIPTTSTSTGDRTRSVVPTIGSST